MTDFGPRVLPPVPRLVGRTWNDVVHELQEWMEGAQAQEDVVSAMLSAIHVSDSDPGGTTVEIDGAGGGFARLHLHMGA